MNAFVTLTNTESKRLIGKAVAAMPIVREKMTTNATILISPGSTTGYVAEEIIGRRIDISKFPCGCIAMGRACRTPEDRLGAVIIQNGKELEYGSERKRETANRFAENLGANDLMIKGANAIDPEGNAGFLLGNEKGGLLMAFEKSHAVRKCPIIIPVGLEKMIASVPSACEAVKGRDGYDRTIGRACGYYMINDGVIVTEIDAIDILSGCKATHVASGGIGTSSGSVVLSIEGTEAGINRIFGIMKSFKDEDSIDEWKMLCKDCEKHCNMPVKSWSNN